MVAQSGKRITYTVGPWTYDPGGIILGANRRTIAVMLNPISRSFREDDPIEEIAANAALIKGAPSLYEAARMIRDADEQGDAVRLVRAMDSIKLALVAIEEEVK